MYERRLCSPPAFCSGTANGGFASQTRPPLAIEFRIFAFVFAGADSGIDGHATGPALHHEVYWNEALQQRNGQLHAAKAALAIGTDGELTTRKSTRQRAGQAKSACGDAALKRWQSV